MALYTVPRERGKAEMIAQIIALALQGHMQGKEMARKQKRSELEDLLTKSKIGESEARAGYYGRTKTRQRIPAEVIAEILKLRKGLTDEKTGIVPGSIEDQLMQSQLGDLLGELGGMQGQEIVETPAEKRYGGPGFLPDILRDLFAKDIPAGKRLRPKGAKKPLPKPISTPRDIRPSARSKFAEAGGLTESKPLPKKLDKATAQEILDEAGGDRNRARKLARERGYIF